VSSHLFQFKVITDTLDLASFVDIRCANMIFKCKCHVSNRQRVIFTRLLLQVLPTLVNAGCDVRTFVKLRTALEIGLQERVDYGH
jgi:hypothetical protein